MERRNNLYPASIRTIEGIKWGYINNKGKLVIAPHYDTVSEFQQNGLAIVWNNGLAGILDRNGRFVVQPTTFSSIYPFSEGLAFVSVGDKGYQVIDETGKIITDKAYPFTYIGDFHEHRPVFQEFVDRKEFLYGYLGSSGKIVIPPQFTYAHDFHDGKAFVGLKNGTSALIGLNGGTAENLSF